MANLYTNKKSIFLSALVIFIIIYIYYVQFHQIKCDQIFLDDVIDSKLLKTGDMIIFKANNNFNSIYTTSYFGHCGIIYIDPSDKLQTPMLFEGNGIERVPLKPHHSKTGIFLTPLQDRVKKYKGRVFWKPLNKELSESTILDFKEFISYALDNMYYNYSVVSSGIKKGIGLERCHNGTNCGEIVFLSLIKLGLLPYEYYDKNIFHHLKFVCNIKNLSDNYYYLDIIEIIDHPFAE